MVIYETYIYDKDCTYRELRDPCRHGILLILLISGIWYYTNANNLYFIFFLQSEHRCKEDRARSKKNMITLKGKVGSTKHH